MKGLQPQVMSERIEPELNHARSSRHRYRGFVQKYKRGQLDESADGADQKQPDQAAKAAADGSVPALPRAKRREHLRAYLRWLWPHRYAVGALFILALLAGGLEMVEPLFMRF